MEGKMSESVFEKGYVARMVLEKNENHVQIVISDKVLPKTFRLRKAEAEKVAEAAKKEIADKYKNVMVNLSIVEAVRCGTEIYIKA
jgi:hypothetical protein